MAKGPDAVALELAGAATSAHLYTAYVHANMVADAASQGLYGAETCRSMLAEQRAFLDILLARGRQANTARSLEEADKTYLAAFIEAAERLANMIRALEALLSVGGPSQKVAYENARSVANDRIRALMG